MLPVYLLISGEWNIPFLFSLMFITYIYGRFITRHTSLKLYHKQALAFLLGLTFLYLSVGSPLASISHFSFSLHMIFMSIHYFIIPPLLLFGIPSTFYRKLKTFKMIFWLKKLIIPPVGALFLFSTLFFVYHLKITLHTFSLHPTAHTFYMIFLFYLAFMIWWPLLPNNEHYPNKAGFAWKSGLLIMPACLYFIITALFGNIGDLPQQVELNNALCFPTGTSLIDFLPFSINERLDQVTAGLVMFGIHKLGLIITTMK